MSQKVCTFLMFDGVAEAALRFYADTFVDAEVGQIEHYGSEYQGMDGKIKRAEFQLGNQSFLLSDSAVKHDFGFTPSISVFIDFRTEEEFSQVLTNLNVGGKILMPPDNYGFSHRYAWIQDRYGVSWQLNLVG